MTIITIAYHISNNKYVLMLLGIGFKSVFSVSDEPEIHSGGYHIKFDRSVSMLEPVWLTQTQTSRWPVQTDRDGTYYETCLRLKFDELALKNIAKLTQSLKEVFDDKLILFLNKLQRMVLEDRCRDSWIRYAKQQLTPQWVQIKADCGSGSVQTVDTITYWLVVRETISDITIRRMNVPMNETEVAVAFKFKASASSATSDKVKPSKKLTLDLSEGLLPLYAFLPTATSCFKFILQGDFVLSTNRESLLDGLDWNDLILLRAADLLVRVLVEMVAWWSAGWLYGSSSDDGVFSEDQQVCTMISQMCSYGFDSVQISITDILGLIPRSSQVPKAYSCIANKVHRQLQDIAMIPDQGGTLRMPCEVISTHLLGFALSDYLSSDDVYALLGKHLILGEVEHELDEELCHSLHITSFDIECVLQCLDRISAHYSSPTSGVSDEGANAAESSESAYPKHWRCNRKTSLRLIGNLFLLLSAFIDHSTSSSRKKLTTAPNKSNRPPTLVPAQVAIRKAGNQLVMAKSSLSLEYKRRLCSMCIWPVKGGAFRSLSANTAVLFIQTARSGGVGSAEASLVAAQNSCLSAFEHLLSFLDDGLFDPHNYDLPETKHASQASFDTLRNFLIHNFRPDSVALTSGGVQLLTPDIVVDTVILPTYKAHIEGLNHEDTAPVLTRATAAAFVAYLYLSKRVIDPTRYELLVPVLSAREKKGDVHWTKPQIQSLKRTETGEDTSSDEVHIGFELLDSTTSELARLHTNTSLRQLNWTILDPLCAVFVFGLRSNYSKLVNTHKDEQDVVSHSSVELRRLFEYLSPSDLQAWASFLSRLGLVDFFKVRATALSGVVQYEAPFLFKYLHHLLRNGMTISTLREKVKLPHVASADLLTAEHAGQVEESDVAPFVNLPFDYLPVYLLSSHSSPAITCVSEAVFKTLVRVSALILRQFQVCGLPSKLLDDSKLMQTLRSMPWLPIHIHSNIHPMAKGLYFVAAPIDIIAPPEKERDLDTYVLGPHCMYLPQEILKLPVYSDLISFYRVNILSIRTEPDVRITFALLRWMSLQTDTALLSKVKFMEWCYKSIYDYVAHSPLNITTLGLLPLLETDSPLIWAPARLADKGNDRTGDYYTGHMVRPSQLVKEEGVVKFFSFDKSPVKVLTNYYTYETSSLFARKMYCYNCQAFEGMFGVRGRPQNSDHGTYSIYDGESRLCECKDEGIGAYCPQLPGLIRKSPSAVDMLALLVHYKERSSELFNDKAELEVLQKETLEIWMSLGSNVWKCFNIDGGLHPYSIDQLEAIVKTLQSEELLPVQSSTHKYDTSDASLVPSTYTRVSPDIPLLALDDLGLYDVFKTDLEHLPHEYKLISCHTPSDAAQYDFASIVKVAIESTAHLQGLDTSSYDLDQLKSKREAFITSPTYHQSVRHIPAQTFFAPRSNTPLLRLLKVPLFSDHVTVNYSKGDPSPHGAKAMEFISLINVALRVAYGSVRRAFAGDGLAGSLALTLRLRSLMDMRVYECASIQQHLTLKLGDREYDSERDYSAQFEIVDGVLSLYLSSNISIHETRELILQLVMYALRVEIALRTLNQQVEHMREVEKLVTKFLKVDSSMIEQLLSLEELDEHCQLSRAGLWQLTYIPPVDKAADQLNTELDVQADAEVDVVDEKVAEQAVSGFCQLKNKAKERAKLARANNTAPAPVVDDTAQMQAYVEAKRIDEAAILQQVLGSGGDAVLVQNTPGPTEEVTSTAPLTVVQYDISIEELSNRRALKGPNQTVDPSPLLDNRIDRFVVDEVDNRPQLQPISRPVPGRQWIVKSSRPQKYDPSNRMEPSSMNQHDLTSFPHSLSSLSHFPRFDVSDHPNRQSQDDLISLLLPEGAMQTIVDAELNSTSPLTRNPIPGPSDAIHTELAPGGQFSGRLGERLAARYLAEYLTHAFPDQQCLCEWVNKDHETGLPYDIIVQLPNSSVVKRCEVKCRTSHSSGDSQHRTRQWPISASEVNEASINQQHYFCILIELHVDYASRTLDIGHIHVIGFTGGLIASLQGAQTQLFIQVNG